MAQNDLNLSSSEPLPELEKPEASGFFVFRFAVRPVLIYILSKWKYILGVFLLSLIFFFFVFHLISKYSSTAWSADAKIFHQTRSEKIPSFYKPMATESVLQFITSHSVYSRVAARMESSKYNFNKSMLAHVDVTMGKGKENVITVLASASTPDAAAAIANAFAEEGVSEYVRRQNNSVKTMIDDRQKQRDDIMRELKEIDAQKKSYNSPVSGLPPNMELDKLRNEVSAFIAKQDEVRIRLVDTDIKLSEVQKAMKDTPKNIEFETTIDNTTSLGLEGKKMELEALLERYTDENPKVKIVREEIRKLEAKSSDPREQVPSRVTYRKNQVYGTLEDELMRLTIERTTLTSSGLQYEREIAEKRTKIASLMEADARYNELVRRESRLDEKRSRIEDGINDLDFLINSSVPDVYVFESASVPSVSNVRKQQIKIAGLGILSAILCAGVIGALRIGKFRILDSSEYSVALGIDSLGNIPLLSEHPEKEFTSAIQNIYHNYFDLYESKKTFLIVKSGAVKDYELTIEESVNLSAMRGVTSFRLNISAISPSDGSENYMPPASDVLAGQLLSIQKNFDKGRFWYRNDYGMDVAEIDLLRFDIDLLSKNYGIIFVEVESNPRSRQIVAQLSELLEYVVFISPFDGVSKLDLNGQITRIRESSKTPMGGVLSDIPKPYFKG